jgi:SAM-dependent methyltransferase
VTGCCYYPIPLVALGASNTQVCTVEAVEAFEATLRMNPVQPTSIPTIACAITNAITSSSNNDNDNNDRIAANRIVIRENGTRHAGCDESSGWIWYAARQLEAVLALEVWSTAGTDATATTDAASQDRRMADAAPRILELGSGTGWLSLHLARRGAIVTATERTGAMALLTQNVMRNQEQIVMTTMMMRHLPTTLPLPSSTVPSDRSAAPGATTTTTTTTTTTLQIDVQELEWSSPHRLEGDWDWIVGTDLLYIHENYAPLLRTIRRHCTNYCSHRHDNYCHSTMCVLSWEERKPHEESTFVQLAKDHGFQIISLLPLGTNPATNNPLWILRMTYNNTNNNPSTDHELPPPQ